MDSFPVHSEMTAPAGSQELLAGVRRGIGFVPNLMGVLAEAPAALEAYLALSKLFESSSLSPVEKQVVLLSVSFENGCDYCVAAHTGLALMKGVPRGVVAALRDGTPIGDVRLEALRAFTASVSRQRARVPEAEVVAFMAAGFSRQQLLEVLLGVTQKTLSNYVNHVANTPLDTAFKAHQWSRPVAPVAG
jgi:uncharacterized peroxidase-related enzyme